MTTQLRKVWSIPEKRAAELAKAFRRHEQRRKQPQQAGAKMGEPAVKAARKKR